MTNSNSNSNSTALTLASPVNDGTASGMSNRHHSSNVAASGMSNGHHSSNSDISSDPSSSSHNFDIADGALEEDARFRYKSSVAALRSIRVYIYSVRESQKKYEGEKAAHRTLKLRKMGRAPCCDKANVKKGPWAPEEDAKLKAYTEKYGTGGNWIALPQKIGCFVTLFSIYAILAHMSGMFSPRSEGGYVETVYPVFSMCALLSLHLFMYGCNLLFWKSTRINYLFIFEFQNHIALKYRDAFLIGTSLMTAVVTAMVIHLILLSSGIPLSQVDALPGVLLLIPLLRHIESTACCFVAGSFKTHRYDTCKSGKLYRELAYVVSFAPYYWRAMQCARRWWMNLM